MVIIAKVRQIFKYYIYIYINIINIYLNYNSLFIKHQFIASIKQNIKYLHRIYVSKK